MSFIPRYEPHRRCFTACSPGTYCVCLGQEIPLPLERPGIPDEFLSLEFAVATVGIGWQYVLRDIAEENDQ